MARIPSALGAIVAGSLALAACDSLPGLGSARAALDVPEVAAGEISEATMKDVTRTLASDAFEGRAPGSAGEAKTIAFLTERFKAAGLQPGNKGSWVQEVPLVEITGKNYAPLTITGSTSGAPLSFAFARDWVGVTYREDTRTTLKDSALVFVGYGINAPERGWNDYAGLDVKGKTVVILVNDPDWQTAGLEGPFGGKAMTYYGRWTYKFEEAARRGAVGFLVIHETDPASYGWATVKNSNTNTIFDIIRANPGEAHAPLEGWIQRDVTVDLFKAAGLDFEALKAKARTRDFRPVELTGVTFSTDHAIRAQKIVSKNVVARKPGRTRPDETVIYSAHWDHLGVGLPDARGDRIYNGALDNSLGTASLLEIARQYAKAPAPDRSVVFLAVTAEEKGLLGSEYYASNPLYPLATTAGVINMDGGSTAGPARDFTTSGDAPLTLQDDLVALGAKRGRSYSPDPRPGAGSFFRSDHFPFAKRGVPAISFGSGQDLVEGGRARGEALARDYTTYRYHQPADEWSPDWDLTGTARDGGLLYDLGRELANSRRWPDWKAGSEFRAVRAGTAAARK